MTEIEQLKAHLQDWKWRMNNLYTFVDWDGNKTIFKMNEVQETLFDSMHMKNIILKARQYGITTYMALFLLDAVLFRPDLNCLFVAHTRDDGENIFNNKVRYAYENLPDWLKKERPYVKMNGGQIIIDHGNKCHSSFRVAVSGRGGTYGYIHVSELGKIAARDPMKAAELVSGTLNAGANAIVTIESTAEGDHGVFFDMCTTAEEDQLLGNSLTRLDYKFFFFPWYDHPNYTFTEEEASGIVLNDETLKYFKELKLDLTHERMAWYQQKKREQGDLMTQEYPSTSEEAFSKPLEGAYYAKQMRKMLNDGRIGDVEWDPKFPVYTSCDIGHSDLTVNLYYQKIGREIRIFDMYVGEGEDNDLQRLCEDIKSKPYTYANNIAPHDMAVYEFGAGATRLEMALNDHGVRFDIAPKEIGILDGIEAVKRMLKHVVVSKDRCRGFISGMRAYRRQRLPDGSFGAKPNHDMSDYADPARYIAVTLDLISHEMLGSGCNIDSGAIY